MDYLAIFFDKTHSGAYRVSESTSFIQRILNFHGINAQKASYFCTYVVDLSVADYVREPANTSFKPVR